MTMTPINLRTDLKCGNSSISPGEKCHKGSSQPRNSSRVKKALRVAAGTALAGAAIYGFAKSPAGRRARAVGVGATFKHAKSNLRRAAGELTSAAKRARYAPSNSLGKRRINAIKNAPMPQAMTVREVTGTGPKNKFVDPWDPTPAAPPVPRALRRFAKRDAIWADGFSPELDQLAI